MQCIACYFIKELAEHNCSLDCCNRVFNCLISTIFIDSNLWIILSDPPLAILLINCIHRMIKGDTWLLYTNLMKFRHTVYNSVIQKTNVYAGLVNAAISCRVPKFMYNKVVCAHLLSLVH